MPVAKARVRLYVSRDYTPSDRIHATVSPTLATRNTHLLPHSLHLRLSTSHCPASGQFISPIHPHATPVARPSSASPRSHNPTQPNTTQRHAKSGRLSAFAPILCTRTAKFMQVCMWVWVQHLTSQSSLHHDPIVGSIRLLLLSGPDTPPLYAPAGLRT